MVSSFPSTAYVNGQPFSQEEQNIWAIIHGYLQTMNASFYSAATEDSFDRGQITMVSREESSLTPTETIIYEYLCDGLNTVEIARKDGRNIRTVYKHIENNYRKLDVSNRQELLIKKTQLGSRHKIWRRLMIRIRLSRIKSFFFHHAKI